MRQGSMQEVRRRLGPRPLLVSLLSPQRETRQPLHRKGAPRQPYYTGLGINGGTARLHNWLNSCCPRSRVAAKGSSRKFGFRRIGFSETRGGWRRLLCKENGVVEQVNSETGLSHCSSAGPHHCQLSHPLASLEEGADEEKPLALIAATTEPTTTPKKRRLTSSFTRILPTLLKEVGDTFTYPCHALQDQARSS